jgi:signal transduction histidine kinase
MKLIYKILLQISILAIIIMSVWAAVFYFVITDEIYDEQDDSLEDYSEILISSYLSSDSLRTSANGTNNDFFFTSITVQEAMKSPHIKFSHEDMYIIMKDEYEPARVLRTIFKDADGDYLRLTIYTPTLDSMDLIEQITSWTVILFLALLISVLIVNILTYKKIMCPLHKLLDWINELKIEKEVTPLDNPTDVQEFLRLNNAVTNFANHSKENYEKQKEFISNASHEIQTPLAVCMNRLELLTNTDLTENQLEEIIKTHNTMKHISRLNKTLLLLSKIDNNQFQESVDVSFNELIDKQLDDFKIAYEHLRVSLKKEENGEFHMLMNDTLAATLVANLIKNAYIHNKENGIVKITVDKDSIIIANTAANLQPLDERKIFERFYQGDKRHSSTGLGLAVVKAIADRYHLNVKYAFGEGYNKFTVSR